MMNKLQLTIVGLLCFVTGYSQVLLSEDFSTATGTTPPSGWTNNDLNTSGEIWEFNNPGTRTLNAPITSPAAIFDSDNYGTGSAEDAALESPAFDASSGTIVLTFDHYFLGGFGGGYAVEVFDGTAWDTIIDGTSSTSNPQSESLDITTLTGGSTSAKVRFHWTGDYSYYWIVDNVTISAVSCLNPSALGATNLTTSAADIYWTTGGASDWNVEYGTAGFSRGTGTKVNSTNDTLSITGLSSNTTYEFYVRDSCAVGDVSTWAGPFSFTTLCGVLPLPYNETFASIIPTCWDEAGDGSPATGPSSLGSGSWSSGPLANTGPSEAYEINIYSDSKNEWVITPEFDLTGGPYQLELDLAIMDYASTTVAGTLGSDDEVQLLITTNGGTTWTALQTWDNTSSVAVGGQHYIVDLTPYAGSTARFAIWATEGTTNDPEDVDVSFDNFEIKAIPACASPTALGAVSIGTISADLFWTTGGASDWNVEYGPAGFAQGGGTLVNATNDTMAVTGLTANTTYEFYVRDSCGVGNVSVWAGPFAFTTKCALLAAPYSQNFDGATAQDPFGGISCWTVIGPGANDIELNSSPDAGIDPAPSSPNSVELNDGDFNGGDTAILVSPAFSDLSSGTNRIRFKAAFENTSEELFVAVLADPAVPSSLVMLDTITATTVDVYTEYIVNLNNLTLIGSAQNVAFIHGNDIYEVYLDDFVYEPLPSCIKPTAIGVAGVTPGSADIYWTTGGASNWEVEYGAPGFTIGAGTRVSASNDTTTISGLSPQTTYEVYVRDSCAVGDVSLWEGPFAFTTSCASQLSGTYTIDAASPAGGTNYTSFADAAAELRTCGVSGAVTFNVAAGVYTENLYLTEILGASSTNTITFNGADSALVTLTYSSSDDTATVYLNGADYITVKNMTIENTSTGDGWGVLLQNSANHNTIDSCHVKMPITTTTDIIGIVATSSLSTETGSGDNTNNLMVSNCLISGAESGVHLEGGTSNGTHNTGNSILNSVFRNQDDHAIEVDGQTGLIISGNDIGNLNNSGGDGIYLVDVDDIEVSANQLIAPDYGIYINDANDGQTPTANSQVVNNMVLSSADNGIYLNDIEYVEVYHNTVVGEPAFLVNDQSNTLIIKNNVFYSSADYALEFLDTLNTTDVIDYNLYYSGAADAFEILTTVYTDLPAWQAANASLNVSSVEGDPVFLNIASDLHLVGTLANNAADPIAGITTDIDGDTRSTTTPDIGADEYTPVSCLPSSAGVAGNITSSSADLSWTAGGGSTFNIEYGLSGYTQGSGTQLSGVTNPYTLSSLSPNTAYDFYIQDDCGINGTSPWIGPFTFSTLCQAFTAPFTEDFEATSPSVGCWSNEYVTDTEDWTLSTGSSGGAITTAHGGSVNAVFVSASGGPDITRFVSPEIDITGLTNPELHFWYGQEMWFSDQNYLNVYYRTSTSGSWTLLWSDSTDQPAWTEEIISLPNGSATYQVAFEGVNNWGRANVLDDVSIVEAPSCIAPTALGSDTTSATSADIYWTTGGASNWNVEYGLSGFVPGSGTALNATNDTVSITGLTSNLLYEFYVRDSCAVGDVSGWAGPFPFHSTITPCDDFEIYSTGIVDTQSALINGWAGAGGDAEISTTYASSGSNSLKIYDSGAIGFSDVVAEVGVYNSGSWKLAFDFYVPSGNYGYYNILHDYQGGGTNVWATEIYLEMGGTATVVEGTNGSDTIGNYSFNMGAWNTVEHIIDLDNDTAYVMVNGVATNVGWQFSLGSTNFGDQFNAVNFYSTAPTGQTSLMYVDDFCISPNIAPCTNTAGLDSAATVCPTNANVDLSNYLRSADPLGTWVDIDATGALAGTDFDATLVAAGSSYNFSYFVTAAGCPNDTATITINVSALPDAGAGLTDTICDSLSTFDLTSLLDAGATAGGTWLDVSATGALNGAIFNPGAVTAGSTYTFRYLVTDSCGADSADFALYVKDCTIGINEYSNGSIAVYPNPGNGIFYIENLGNGSQTLKVEVYTVSGKLLMTSNYNGTNKGSLDLSSFAAGFYYLKVSTDELVELHPVMKE